MTAKRPESPAPSTHKDLRRADERAVEWAVSPGLTPYPFAVAAMEARAHAIAGGAAPELVWLLEHPPLYTAGVSARRADLRAPDRLPVFESKRGGGFTYHGPGQRVAYLMLDLAARGRDVRAFVRGVEDLIIDALAAFGVKGERRAGRVGVWVDLSPAGGEPREDKVAAIGVRIRRWVSFHGLSLNVAPELSDFDGISPCGIDAPGLGVTSLAALGVAAPMATVDAAIRRAFEAGFGPTVDAAAPVGADKAAVGAGGEVSRL